MGIREGLRVRRCGIVIRIQCNRFGCFKKWATSNSYVLINHWTADFVRRRELAAGDEIGMCWDSFYSRFNFSILKRAPAPTIIVQDHADVAASRS
ncbi:hypothetical protein CUMW_091220 [Citrus unshiu]|nr:hypothetical protein CUMW_091220 [Citrus unshiu]